MVKQSVDLNEADARKALKAGPVQVAELDIWAMQVYERLVDGGLAECESIAGGYMYRLAENGHSEEPKLESPPSLRDGLRRFPWNAVPREVKAEHLAGGLTLARAKAARWWRKTQAGEITWQVEE